MDTEFERLLAEAVRFHGHLCEGQVIGVKMAVAALGELDIRDPRSALDLVIFSEIDRCPLDALISVVKRTPGKRSVKILDYGKTAATLADAVTGRGVRVSLRSDAYARVEAGARQQADPKAAAIAALKAMPAEELLSLARVRVFIPPEDRPGEFKGAALCEACGERIRDHKEVMRYGRVLCRPCAEGKAYYRVEDDAFPG